jgi:cell shape-determining protein MreD
MNIKRTQIAAVLAFAIGAMAVFAGGRVVLLGILPDYYLIDWLPVYNFTMGLVTVGITAVLIWRNGRYARPAAVATFAAHALVMLILLAAYRDVVALDSLVAMTVRLVAWAVILALLLVRKSRDESLKLP